MSTNEIQVLGETTQQSPATDIQSPVRVRGFAPSMGTGIAPFQAIRHYLVGLQRPEPRRPEGPARGR